jgi:hypothetical protein
MSFDKVFVMMIGLPCSGKSFLASSLTGFLSENSVQTMEFNIGKKRREF